MPEDRLDEVLASVGEHLAVEPEVDVAASAGDRWPRRLLIAAVVVAVLGGIVVAVAPARRTVSDWFRAGRIEVELTRDTSANETLPVFTDAVEPIDPADADDVLGSAMPDVAASALGPPRSWGRVPEGGVVVGWPDGTSLWVSPAGGGPDFTKEGTSDQAFAVADLGDLAFAISGEHVLQSPHRRVAADSAVVWEHGDLWYRLEGPADASDLVEVARQLAS